MSTNDDDDLAEDLAALREDALPDDLLHRIVADSALESARRAPPVPSGLLMARIARDARRVARARRRRDWGTLAGLAAACATGVVVGLSDPGGLVGAALPAAPAYDQLAAAYDFQIAEPEE